MVDLISKEARDDIGLTSWWRAIVWSAISLKSSASNPAVIDSIPNYPYANNIRIALGRSVSDGALGAALTIEATLPYAKSSGINAAGKFIPHLKEFYSGLSVLYSADNCATLASNGYTVSGDGAGLPDEPNYVNTLEKYFLWVCWEGERELLDPLPNKLLPITIDFFEESTPDPTIKVKAIIPIDYVAYRASGNFICSVLDPGFQLSPAGLRSFSWVEIIGKPTFHPVATSGNYNDLTNTPSIPDQVSDLTGYSALVRSVNGNSPNPVTGDVDLSLNVGSVEWSNVNNKPTFHSVATSGNYNDLTNPPSIPNNVAQLTGYSALVRSVNGNSPNPVTGNVELTIVSDWSNLQGKPTFSAVAFSGSYNDLSDKPVIPDAPPDPSGIRIEGTKTIYGQNSNLLVWASNGDNNGLITFLGTNNGSQAFSNPTTDLKVTITNNGSFSGSLSSLTDQNLTSNVNISPTAIDLKFDLIDYSLIPSKISFYANGNSSNANYRLNILGSVNNIDWTNLGTVDVIGTTQQWYSLNLSSNTQYRYFRLQLNSIISGTSSIFFRSVEFYGEVFNNNVSNGSLVSSVPASDIYYVLIPDIKVGSFVLPDLFDVPVGSAFYFMNPHPTSLTISPASGQTAYYTNGFSTIDQWRTAFCFAISSTEWNIF